MMRMEYVFNFKLSVGGLMDSLLYNQWEPITYNGRGIFKLLLSMRLQWD